MIETIFIELIGDILILIAGVISIGILGIFLVWLVCGYIELRNYFRGNDEV